MLRLGLSAAHAFSFTIATAVMPPASIGGCAISVLPRARTPFRSPRANAIAERMRSVRTECLDHVFIFNEPHLQKVLAEYVGYFNLGADMGASGSAPPGRDCTLLKLVNKGLPSKMVPLLLGPI
jgi:hypothetical protein